SASRIGVATTALNRFLAQHRGTAPELGMDTAETAEGILRVSAWNQANALRQVTVQRGLDVRDFHLVAFGGSGSLLLCPLLDVLGPAGAFVPPDPANVSAFGLLSVDVRNDYVRTRVARHADLDPAATEAVFGELASEAAACLSAEGFADEGDPDGIGGIRLERSADLRYFGQGYEVRVPVPSGPLDAAGADAVAAAFHSAHRDLYGYDLREDPNQQVEWVNLRVTGIGRIRRPEPRSLSLGGESGRDSARTGARDVRFDGTVHADTPVYRRDLLASGRTVSGPAVIEEYAATLPLHPGFTARVHPDGGLAVTADTPPAAEEAQR
ncbi:hydantoinase/oxoprolinase family protein, partial [Streptomonospora algeriensis]